MRRPKLEVIDGKLVEVKRKHKVGNSYYIALPSDWLISEGNPNWFILYCEGRKLVIESYDKYRET